MTDLALFIWMIITAIAIAVIIIAFLNFLLRRRIIEAGIQDENYIKLLSKSFDFKLNTLKWGIILLFGGLGMICIEFIPFELDASPLPYGVEALFLAGGFLIYYLIANKKQ